MLSTPRIRYYDPPVPDEWKQRVARRSAAVIGALVMALVGLLVWSYHQRASETVHVAVLPFRGDSQSTRLAATITQLLAHRLAHVPRFAIVPATATAAFATGRDSAHAIGRALGVQYLIVGEVDRSPTVTAPDRIVIDTRLIDTGDSPPAIGDVVTTLSTDLCPAVAVIAIDIAGHFARAPRGHLWGAGGVTGCAAPKLLVQQLDPGA